MKTPHNNGQGAFVRKLEGFTVAKDGNAQRMENLPQVISTVETQFTKIARVHGAVDFATEAEFAMQIMRKSDYLAQVAFGNLDSLKEAIINVAAIGLTLNPALKLAYLVPRSKAVCLDISYQGYIFLGTSCGAILWAGAEIVCESDKFEHLGMNQSPIHKFNPMFQPDSKERGPVIGGYCLAKTPSGESIIAFMPINEILNMRDRSEGWKAHKKDGKQTPWITDEFEMIKKTLIRRAFKSWPKSAGADRLAAAVDLANDSEIISLPEPKVDPSRLQHLVLIREMLLAIDREESAYVGHLSKVTNRKIEKLEDLTDIEIVQAIALLQSIVDTQSERIAKLAQSQKKVQNENVG